MPDPQEGAVAVVAEGAKEPADLEDDEDEGEEEEEEAEIAFAVLLEQGKDRGGSKSKQGFQLHLSCLNVWLS